jgi:phospholipid-binding lipoprotein MlaA
MNTRKPAFYFVCFILTAFILLKPHAFGAQVNPGTEDTQAASPPVSDRSPSKGSLTEDPVLRQADDTEFENEFDFSEDEASVSPVRVADPLEPLNRVIFQVNDKLYFWLLKPATQGYKFVIPEDFRLIIRNFFSNVLTPVRLANCILQGKMKNAETEVARFFVNSTIGILGFGDPGKQMFNMDISDEDLGQTLGRWGFGNGFYIVWPVIGPSTLRESAGFFGDLWVNPIGYLQPAGAAVSVGAYRRLNDLSFRIGEYEAIKAAAIEPYSAVRDGYIQFRNTLVDK